MSDYTRAAVDRAGAHAKFSSYDVLAGSIDDELTKVAVAIATKVDPGTDQAMTVSGAVSAGVSYLSLAHTDTVIAATIANAANHAGVFIVENISTSGTAAHTVTLTTGTWDGTNDVATLNAGAEQLVVFFNAAGRGRVILNTGAVGLS
jgi:hypothetical protein